jgi:hypothetical protein
LSGAIPFIILTIPNSFPAVRNTGRRRAGRWSVAHSDEFDRAKVLEKWLQLM